MHHNHSYHYDDLLNGGCFPTGDQAGSINGHGNHDIGATTDHHHSHHGVTFGTWEKWPSGYSYQRNPDGSYSGNWGT